MNAGSKQAKASRTRSSSPASGAATATGETPADHLVPRSGSDLDDIVERLSAGGSRVNAEKVLDRFESSVGTLRYAPNRGRVVPELAAYGIRRYRELVLPPWRLIYRVEARAVYVLTLVDSRRDLDELLLERLIRTD